MSIFNWFSHKSPAPASTSLPSDGLSVLPPSTSSLKPVAHVSSLKVKRQDRREQLYKVVRDVMLRAEILAASYKFKVLSLDTHGRQFLIMMDMLDPQTLSPDRFAEIEHLIVSGAAQRHDLLVKSVYWRVSTPALTAASPAPPGAATRVAAQVTATQQALKAKSATKIRPYEPIQQDEVLAFQKALAPSQPNVADLASGKLVTSGPRHAPLPKGFEDTLLLESEDAVSPLSNTQYGDL